MICKPNLKYGLVYCKTLTFSPPLFCSSTSPSLNFSQLLSTTISWFRLYSLHNLFFTISTLTSIKKYFFGTLEGSTRREEAFFFSPKEDETQRGREGRNSSRRVLKFSMEMKPKMIWKCPPSILSLLQFTSGIKILWWRKIKDFSMGIAPKWMWKSLPSIL